VLSRLSCPKFSYKLLFLLVVISIPAFQNISVSLAVDPSQSIDTLQQKRLEYENKIRDLQGKEKTLKNEISLMDNKMNVTLTKIQEAVAAIKLRGEELNRLSGDIGMVTGKIDVLGQTLATQREIFSARAVEAYKNGNFSYLEMFLGSYDFSFFINRIKYLRVFESNDNKFLQQMEDTRKVFQTQKIILADKKDQVEQIKVQIEADKVSLEQYKVLLARQKDDKQKLLSLTLNDETKYQQLLTQILAEIESVARSLKGGVKIGEVKRGDVVAHEGNSGCVLPSPSHANSVAGAHLHFGVYKDGVAVDPKPFLDRGDLGWPESPTTVTQNFGENYDFYMRNFGIPGHNATDMSRGYGTPIYAAADGVAYETGDSRQYATWCNGKARGVRIEHPNGLITIYWHVL
jgi:peptidoglycan hydrolase CwlO-like protein